MIEAKDFKVKLKGNDKTIFENLSAIFYAIEETCGKDKLLIMIKNSLKAIEEYKKDEEIKSLLKEFLDDDLAKRLCEML